MATVMVTESRKLQEIIEQAHDTYTSVLVTTTRNSLGCVLCAYFTAPGYYNIVRGMPAGKGNFTDFAFIPRSIRVSDPQ